MNTTQREGIFRAYYATFTSVSGAEVLEDLSRAYMMVEVHTPGDPYTTAYRAGQQAVVRTIHQILAYIKEGHGTGSDDDNRDIFSNNAYGDQPGA